MKIAKEKWCTLNRDEMWGPNCNRWKLGSLLGQSPELVHCVIVVPILCDRIVWSWKNYFFPFFNQNIFWKPFRAQIWLKSCPLNMDIHLKTREEFWGLKYSNSTLLRESINDQIIISFKALKKLLIQDTCTYFYINGLGIIEEKDQMRGNQESL